MKLIARHSIKYSILGYIGYAIGTVSSIFLYPFDFSFSGEIRFLQSSSLLLMPILLFGSQSAIVRFFSFLKERKQQQNFYLFGLCVILCNALVISLLYLLIRFFFHKPYFINDIWESFPLILLLAFSGSCIILSSKYISNLNRISIPSIFENLMPKLAAATAFILFYFFYWKATQALYVFVGISFISLFGILIYLNSLEKLSFKNPISPLKDTKFKSEYLRFSLYSLLGGVGHILTSQIDITMINEMIGDFETGTYGTMLSIIGLIIIPFYALNAIASPIVSKQIYEQKWHDLKRLYQNSSLNLFFIGSLLLCCILAGSDSLFHLMKNGNYLLELKPVLWILGLGILFDMATGINSQIITFSKYYKFNIYLNLLLAFATLCLNYVFIKHSNFGTIGVAISTCISLVLYNIVKLIFIYKKFKITPFSQPILKVLFLFLLGLLTAFLLPEAKIYWLSLVYKPLAVILLFLIGNYFLKLIPLQNITSKNWKNELMGNS